MLMMLACLGGQVKGRAADADEAGLPRAVRCKRGRLMLMLLACLGRSGNKGGRLMLMLLACLGRSGNRAGG